MRKIHKRVFICLLTVIFCHGLAQSQSLDKYLWKNRLLFLNQPQGEDIHLQEQIESFQGREQEIQDRQLLIFVIKGNQVSDINGNPVQLDPGRMAFTSYTGMILIGKDGGIKLQEPFVVEPQRIFNLIDSMPMRRAELKNSEKY